MSETLGRRSPILEKLAELYAESTVGLTGIAEREFGIPFPRLLRLGRSTSGDALEIAQADLRRAATAGAIVIDEHRRSHDWQRIRVPATCEAALFALIERISPTQAREAWADLFERAAPWTIPDKYQAAWLFFCQTRAEQGRAGIGWKPFRRAQRQRAAAQLEVTAKLLAWNRPSLLRTVSAQLAGSSKFLERCASTIETLLAAASGGVVRSFADLQIEHNPASVRFHGPVRIGLGGTSVDYGHHSGESSISETDLDRIEFIQFDAPRCVTVENATKFHELCRMNCNDVFVFTSYPNKATVEFLRRLPPALLHFHFGDTDPWGFDVLRSLRKELGRRVLPLHMRYRPKADSATFSVRDRRKLTTLLTEPLLEDVREELLRLDAAGRKGDWEQESFVTRSADFPYNGNRFD